MTLETSHIVARWSEPPRPFRALLWLLVRRAEAA